jgi:hypothetical protein
MIAAAIRSPWETSHTKDFKIAGSHIAVDPKIEQGNVSNTVWLSAV